MKKMDLTENQNLEQQAVTTQNEVDEKVEMGENQNLSVETAVPQSTAKETTTMNQKAKKTFIIICTVATVAGILTGYGAFKLNGKTASNNGTELNAVAEDPNKISNGDIFGVQDESTFVDNAQGYVEKGGVNGEGSHRLLREGGTSQTIALTSAVTDLDQFVGMEIKIWGETHKAQQSGWFMDVGRVEVTNTEAESPIQSLE